MSAKCLKLENRSVIRLSGSEKITFLNGLVTNDIETVAEDKAVYAALLTPQGKFMFDMLIIADGSSLLLDIEADRKPDLMRRLMMYKLRADVDISDTDLSVWAIWDGKTETGVVFKDPRHENLGFRVLSATAPTDTGLDFIAYEESRIKAGVPDGNRDILTEKYFWLETNAEALNGVSFSKGCYVGQELTARMKHRTTLKKMIVPVKLTDGSFKTGAAITTTDGSKAGEIRTTAGDYALAYLKLAYKDDDLKTETASFRTL